MARRKSGSSSSRGPSKALWVVFGRLGTVAAGVVSLRVVNLLWRLVTGRKAPATPENPDVTLIEAATWAVLSGAVAQLAKIVVTRRAVNYWLRSTGDLPPGISPGQVSPEVKSRKR